MHQRRTNRNIVRALLAGTAVVAAASAGQPAEAASAQRVSPLARSSTTTVRVVTGDQIAVTQMPGGRASYVMRSAAGGGAQSYQGANGDHYLVPAVALPYLGRQLDLSLFDVTALANDGIGGATRIPVTVTFAAGTTPAAPPGVTFTSVDGSSASGYLTPTSERSFADALRARIGADVAAGRRPGTSSLADGLTGMRLDAAILPAPAQPRYPQHILQINALDETGAPGNFPVFLMNTDSLPTENIFVMVVDGIARIAVPAGHYLASATIGSYDDEGNTISMRAVTINDFTVTDAPSANAVTVDMRTATSAVSVHTPRPATQDSLVVHDFRFDTSGLGIDIYSMMWGSAPIYVNAQPAAKSGKLHYLVQWGGAAPNPSDGYRYDVAFASDNGIPADETYTARPDQLATVHHHFAADPAYAGNPVYLLSGASDPQVADEWGVPGEVSPIDGVATAPGGITQYLGTADGGAWANTVSWPFAYLSGDARTYAAGRDYDLDWAHGPLAAGLGQFTGNHRCDACTAGDTLTLGIPEFHDSRPDHTSDTDGGDWTHFTLYRDGTSIADEQRGTGAVVDGIPSTASTYRAVLDVDLSGMAGFSQATRTHTDVTVKYAPDGGSALPAPDTCFGQTASTPCQVLPVLTLSYALATDDTNTSRLPVQILRLNVGHVSYDGAGSRSRITSATVSVSDDNGATWQPATVAGTAGHYLAMWHNPAAGTAPALRVTARDAAGNTITQTIANAYTVGAS